MSAGAASPATDQGVIQAKGGPSRAARRLEDEAISPLVRVALGQLAPVDAELTRKSLLMQHLGFGEMETAKHLGISWRALDGLRLRLQGEVIHALRSDGYGDGEVARYLGVGASVVAAHGHESLCQVALAGEATAVCCCRQIRADERDRKLREEQRGGIAERGW